MQLVRIISIYTLTLLFLPQVCEADEIEDEVAAISALMWNDPDSAITRSENLLESAKDQNHEYGIVQANFLQGYIYDKIKVDFAKSIIYYLEGIRYASQSSYLNAKNNEVSLRKNCGVIYRKFKAFDLAISQYSEALEITKKMEDYDQAIRISYNLAGVYSDMGKPQMGINILEEASLSLTPDHSLFFDVNNRLAQFYIDTSQLTKAKAIAELILSQGSPTPQEKIDSHQILARVEINRNNLQKGSVLLEDALIFTTEMEDGYDKSKSLFECNLELGQIHLTRNEYHKSEDYFSVALIHLPELDQKPNFYKVYKELATVYFHQRSYTQAKKYEDLYSDALNSYLKTQEEIQNRNQMYNMDLITKRYYDEVEKQERISSILFYSRSVSLGLLILLLGIVGFNRYEKVKLRREIVSELIKNKMIS